MEGDMSIDNIDFDDGYELDPDYSFNRSKNGNTMREYKKSGSKTIKCRNYKNKKCIILRGKKHYYVNNAKGKRELAKKLRITIKKLETLIKNNNQTRIIKNEKDETMKIDVAKKLNYGLLSRKFGIKRIVPSTLMEKYHEFYKGNTLLVDKLGYDEDIRCKIKIELYISFESDRYLSRDKFTKHGDIDGEFDYGKANDAILCDPPTLHYRSSNYDYDGPVGDIEYTARIFFDEEIHKWAGVPLALIYQADWTIISLYGNMRMKLEDGFIRENKEVLELTEWANIEYDNEKLDTDIDSCAVKIISKMFPDLYWDFKNLETKHGIIVHRFFAMCQVKNIDITAYDIHSKIIKEIRNEKKIGLITCIIYNNHIYPVIGDKLKKRNISTKKIEYVKDSEKHLKELLQKKILPSNIKIDSFTSSTKIEERKHINIVSYVVKDIKYICNHEHERCLNFLKSIKKEEFITDGMRIKDIPRVLEKIYKVDDVSSFIPDKDKYKKKALMYLRKGKITALHKIVGIDKNKCYTYCMYKLPYLIKFDYRSDNINKISKKESDTYDVKDKNLYLATPESWSTLMQSTELYSGYHIKKCRNAGLKFILKEELETEIVPNYFRKFIDMTRKYLDETDLKNAWNMTIGTFEKSMGKSYHYNYSGIFTDEALPAESGFSKKIGKYNLLFDSSEKITNVRDRLPISLQIKDMARSLIFDKINELQIKDEDIVHINTDAIYYYGKIPTGLNNDFDGWKSCTFEKANKVEDPIDDSDKTLFDKELQFDTTRKAHIKYAGSGKTTYIVEKLVPRLIKKKISYIVLTPSHQTLSEYKNEGINCEIIQKYMFNKMIPDEKYIIVDEVGFIGRKCHDFLYKLVHNHKDLEVFGDFNQMLPIGEIKPNNQPHYLKYMFTEINTDFTNYRNKFTTDYYDKLINSKNKEYLQSEVKKWSSKLKDIKNVERVLCYRLDTKKKYNNILLKLNGFKKWTDTGVKVYCKNNKMKDIDIYNHKEFYIYKIKKIEDMKIFRLIDIDGIEYDIPEKKFIRNFDVAYAINIHQAQGMTLDSYYWAPEDNKFITNRSAYTIISRLKN